MLMGIIAIVLAIIAAFNPDLIWIFVLVVGLFELYTLMMSVRKAPELKKDFAHKLTSSELAMWKKYPTFLNFPITSRKMSSSLSLLQFVSIGLGVVLLFRGEYIWGILIGLNYFFAAPMAVKLNPQFFFHEQSQKGDSEALANFEDVSSTLEKLHRLPTGEDDNPPSGAPKSTERNWKDIV